jgi:hypothetical protein
MKTRSMQRIISGHAQQAHREYLKAFPPAKCDMCGGKITKENQDNLHPGMCKPCVWELRCEI